MPHFPSDAWMQAFCDEVAAHPDIARTAHALDGVYRFVVLPAGPVTDERVYDVEIRPDQPDPTVRPLPPDGDRRARLVLTAGYDRWKQLLTGQLDVGPALLLRRLRVKGELGSVTSAMSDAGALLDSVRAVDSQFV